jgi:hypothetical protein
MSGTGASTVLGDEPAQVQPAMAVAAGAPDLYPGHAADEVPEALNVRARGTRPDQLTLV